jgi:hypothetical protein
MNLMTDTPGPGFWGCPGRAFRGCTKQLDNLARKNNHIRVYRLPSFKFISLVHRLTVALLELPLELIISGLMRTNDAGAWCPILPCHESADHK